MVDIYLATLWLGFKYIDVCTVPIDDIKFESANINEESEKWFYRSVVKISGKNEICLFL